MHAVILAGGRGVRLGPITSYLPKPLVPIGDEYPILEVVIRQLKTQGFSRLTLAIGHLGHLIRACIGDGSRWDLDVMYVTEEEPLGTAGCLTNLRDELPEHFLVMNGDVLTNLDFAKLLDSHTGSSAPITVAVANRHLATEFGVLDVRGEIIAGIREKPVLDYQVSMGVYAVSRDVLKAYPPGEPLGFDRLLDDLVQRGTPPRAHIFDGYWLDIGRPDDYARANEEFPQLRSLLLPHAC
ncbi:sugar phosphate nucleotidyltransferase [Streptomyces sp. NPDC002992]|uniref:sugar phosphate nucleotidyltransferase n=1 Tax=Streptomyces sp. NPDC002992 TaxID=3154273 RepID=UPI0033ABE3E9